MSRSSSSFDSYIVEDPTPKVKLSILGDTGVGKSCLIKVFETILENPMFDAFQSLLKTGGGTIGLDMRAKVFQLSEDRRVKLNIWDTAGQEKYRAINKTYYFGTKGVLICFDLSQPLEIEEIKSWMDEVQSYISEECCIVIIGTKNDKIPNKETVDLLTKFTNENKLEFIQTSSMDGTNVYSAFGCLIKKIDQSGKLGIESSSLSTSKKLRRKKDSDICVSRQCC